MTNGFDGTASALPLTQQKQDARKAAQAVRKARAASGQPADLLPWADSIFTLSQGGVVAGYHPIGSEIDVKPLMHHLAAMGCRLALPLIVGPGMPLQFHLWDSDTKFKSGVYGIMEPDPTTPQVRPRVILAPLLAFDRQGWRLGYGGGFYDRTLAALGHEPPVSVLGVAYAAQEVPHVPHDGLDFPLTTILTETEMITP